MGILFSALIHRIGLWLHSARDKKRLGGGGCSEDRIGDGSSESGSKGRRTGRWQQRWPWKRRPHWRLRKRTECALRVLRPESDRWPQRCVRKHVLAMGPSVAASQQWVFSSPRYTMMMEGDAVVTGQPRKRLQPNRGSSGGDGCRRGCKKDGCGGSSRGDGPRGF